MCFHREVRDVPKSFRVLLRLLVLTLVPIGCIYLSRVAAVLYVDPLEIMRDRKSSGSVDFFFTDMRLQAPGAIRRFFLRNAEGKVAILGSSVGQFILPDDVADMLGYTGVFNFTANATSPREVADQLRLLVKSESLHTIVCTVERHLYFYQDDFYDHRVYMPAYYRDNVFARASYALDGQVSSIALAMLFNCAIQEDASELFNPDALYRMRNFARQKKFTQKPPRDTLLQKREESRKLGIEAYEKIGEDRKRGIESSLSFPVVDQLVDLARANPKVRFILYIPPFAHLYEDVFIPGRDGTWELELGYHYYYGMKHLVEKLDSIPNATVYAFDDCPEIIENYDNYADPFHPAIGVPRYFLYSVREGMHIVDRRNVDAYLERVFSIWNNGSLYSDPENTIGFEGPIAEKEYSEYPYPKSRYALK